MDILAKKLINDHRNPVVKVEISGSKLFFKCSTSEETEYIEKHRVNLESILNHERAERRCARSQAEWLSQDKRAIVTKSVKTLSNFGYRDKNGTYLYPEEALYLMENNRLEVTFNEVPLSIQGGYNLLLETSDLLNYRVYKKLVVQGYKLLRHSELTRRLLKAAAEAEKNRLHSEIKNVEVQRKRIAVDSCELDSKKKKLECKADKSDLESSTSTSSKQSQLIYIEDIFERLRKSAPRKYIRKTTEDVVPDYCLFLPNNKSRCEYDFNLYICKDANFLRKDNYSTRSVFAICTNDNISFYKFGNVNLPFL